MKDNIITTIVILWNLLCSPLLYAFLICMLFKQIIPLRYPMPIFSFSFFFWIRFFKTFNWAEFTILDQIICNISMILNSHTLNKSIHQII